MDIRPIIRATHSSTTGLYAVMTGVVQRGSASRPSFEVPTSNNASFLAPCKCKQYDLTTAASRNLQHRIRALAYKLRPSDYGLS